MIEVIMQNNYKERRCLKCSHLFQSGEKAYKHSLHGRVKGYVCKDCYEGMSIDIKDEEIEV